MLLFYLTYYNSFLLLLEYRSDSLIKPTTPCLPLQIHHAPRSLSVSLLESHWCFVVEKDLLSFNKGSLYICRYPLIWLTHRYPSNYSSTKIIIRKLSLLSPIVDTHTFSLYYCPWWSFSLIRWEMQGIAAIISHFHLSDETLKVWQYTILNKQAPLCTANEIVKLVQSLWRVSIYLDR